MPLHTRSRTHPLLADPIGELRIVETELADFDPVDAPELYHELHAIARAAGIDDPDAAALARRAAVRAAVHARSA